MTEPTRPQARRARVRVYRSGSAERPHAAAVSGDTAVPGDPDDVPADQPRRPSLPRPVIIAILMSLVAALLAGMLAAASVLAQDSPYRSQTVVEIRRNDLFVDVNPGTISVLNALRSKYAALIATEPIVGPAAESSGLPPSQVRSAVGAAITSDSLLFYPFATAGSPERAKLIAQEATEALVAYAEDEQRDAGVAADARIELRIVQAAGLGNEIGPDTRRATVVGVAAAVIAGVGAYALAEVLWIRRRNRGPVRARTAT